MTDHTTATASTTITNGIDVPVLARIKDSITNQPTLGKCAFRVENRWADGRRSENTIREFDLGGQTHPRSEPIILDADAPPALHGEGRGASPLEYALTALLSCATTTLVAQAALHGIELRSVQSRAEADLDLRGFFGITDEVRKGFEQVRVVFDIDADAAERDIQVLVRAAMRSSPMVDLFMRGTGVEIDAVAA